MQTAIQTLRNALITLYTNEPINRTKGETEQADQQLISIQEHEVAIQRLQDPTQVTRSFATDIPPSRPRTN